MLLQLQRYLQVTCKPGKEMHLPDTLSRAYLNERKEHLLNAELEVSLLNLELPISSDKLKEFHDATAKDSLTAHTDCSASRLAWYQKSSTPWHPRVLVVPRWNNLYAWVTVHKSKMSLTKGPERWNAVKEYTKLIWELLNVNRGQVRNSSGQKSSFKVSDMQRNQ